MDKRPFLKTTSALAGGALLSRFESCAPKERKEHLKNWAGNLEFSTENVFYPKSVEEVQDLVRKCKKLRPLAPSFFQPDRRQPRQSYFYPGTQ
jgi:xylitol oxidase